MEYSPKPANYQAIAEPQAAFQRYLPEQQFIEDISEQDTPLVRFYISRHGRPIAQSERKLGAMKDPELHFQGVKSERKVITEMLVPDLQEEPVDMYKHVSMYFSEVSRTKQSSAVNAETLKIRQDEFDTLTVRPEPKRYKPLNTTYVVDAISDELDSYKIDPRELAGPDISFDQIKKWVNTLFDQKLKDYIQSFGVQTPDMLGEEIYEQLISGYLQARFGEKDPAAPRSFWENEVQQENEYIAQQLPGTTDLEYIYHLLLKTHETTLYGLQAFIGRINNMNLINYSDSIRVDVYSDRILFSHFKMDDGQYELIGGMHLVNDNDQFMESEEV